MNFIRTIEQYNGLSKTRAWPILNGSSFEYVTRCLSSSELSGSSLVVIRELEEQLSEWLGGEPAHVVATNSGTAALTAALLAVGVSAGDQVICPAYTWCATPLAAALIGAEPIFADIQTNSFNICPDDIEKRVTPKTRAIIAVHIHGMSCDMDEICAIGKRHGIPIIEDAAQAHGAIYKGNHVGLLGDIGCFSMQKSKHLGAGDGGFVSTRNAELAQKVRDICNFGWRTPTENYGFNDFRRNDITVFRESEQIGGMFRLNPLSAALALAQLPPLSDQIAILQTSMTSFCEYTTGLPYFELTQVPPDRTHVWHKIRVGIAERAAQDLGHPMHEIRDELRAHLKAAAIPTTMWTAPILPLQTTFQKANKARDWIRSTAHSATEASFIIFDEAYPLIAQDAERQQVMLSSFVRVWTDYFKARIS